MLRTIGLNGKEPEKNRKLLIAAIRIYLIKSELCSKIGMGFEHAEETILTMIRIGLIRFAFDTEKNERGLLYKCPCSGTESKMFWGKIGEDDL